MELHWVLLWKYISVMCVVMVLNPVVHGLTWARSPVNTTVQRGRDAILYCQFSGLSEDGIVVWQKGKSILFIGHKKYSAPSRYEIFGSKAQGEYHIKVSRAEESDDDQFECGAEGNLRKTVHLQVIVPPSSPTLTIDQKDTLRAGQTVNFNCSSRGGNPVPTFTWYRNGQLVTSGHVTYKPAVKFGVTSSILTWTLTRKDNSANFTCLVENEGNQGAPLAVSVKKDVLYKPVVWFEPSTPLKILKNTNSELRCMTDANPPVTSTKWLKAGSPVSGSSSVYRIENANPAEHSTTYTCTATNTLGDGTNTTSVDVLYKPIVTIPYVSGGYIRVNESDDVSITCVVSANPKENSVTWHKEGSSAAVSGNQLLIHKIERTHAGRYTCEASNLLLPTGQLATTGKGNSTVHVIVQYRPGTAQIEQSSQGQVVKGQRVILRCSSPSPGAPSATFRWTKEGDSNFYFDGANLVLSPVELTDNGIYTCTPRNVLGEGVAARIKLSVNEPVSFLAPELETKKYVFLRNSGGVSVLCRARGRPTPQITWYKDDNPIPSSSSLYTVAVTRTAVDVHSTMVTSVLQWKGTERKPSDISLRVEDAGNYTCLASNGVLQEESRSVHLFVQYSPVVSVNSDKVAADIGQTVSLTCTGHAYPAPAFTWHRNGFRVTESYKLRLTTSGTGSLLNITNVKASDLGEYMCSASNDLGNNSASVILSVKTVPEAPSGLRILNLTWESVLLSWQPGFNGGYDQWFFVSYFSADNQSVRKKIPVQPRYSTLQNITGLLPSQQYTFSVFGENSLGRGSYSGDVSVTTDGFYVPAVISPKFSEANKILTFSSPSESYCVRVAARYSPNVWKIIETCAPSAGGSIKLNVEKAVSQVNVSLCLDRRQDVCSQPVVSRFVKEEGEVVPATTIMIVGCVCGAVVVILLIVLAVLFCRRRKGSGKESRTNETDHDRQIQTVMSSTSKTHNQSQPVSHNDIGLESVAGFSSDTSHILSDPYDPRYGHIARPSHPVGRYPSDHLTVPLSWSKHDNIPHEAPPKYSEHHYQQGGLDVSAMNRRNKRPHSEPDLVDLNSSGESANSGSQKSPSIKLETNSTGSSVESGYSTPDPTKPKKVIYEVIV